MLFTFKGTLLQMKTPCIYSMLLKIVQKGCYPQKQPFGAVQKATYFQNIS